MADQPHHKYPMNTPTAARASLALARRDYFLGLITGEQYAKVRRRIINQWPEVFKAEIKRAGVSRNGIDW
jgi:hypothetical protein